MKKKPVLTRKQRAVRWSGRLILLIVLCQILGMNYLFPARTIAGICQTRGMEEGSVFYSTWGKYAPMRTKRVYLSHSGEYLLLSAAQFHPLMGWYNVGPGIALDPNDPEQRDASWFVRKKDGDGWICLAGFVPDGEQAPTISMGRYEQTEEWVDDLGFCRFAEEPLTVTPVPNIPVEGGSCYLEFYPFETREENGERVGSLIARNEDGWLSELDVRMTTIMY